MKKILIFSCLFLIAFLFAAEHEVVDNSHFSEYQKEPTSENFQKAFNHYSKQKNDFNAQLFLSYLHVMEINSLIAEMETNYDSLNTKEKFSYANLLLEINRLDECLPIYEELNADFPAWPCPWRHKGEALMKQGKLEEAETATLKSIETREDHFDAYIQLAEVQKLMNKPEEALQNLNKGLSYYDSDPEGEVSDSKIKKLKAELEAILRKKEE